MGTKLQANAFFPECCSATGLGGNTSNGSRSLFHRNQFVKNCQNHDSSQMFENDFLGNDSEKVRQTILKHESIFRNQLQELHRLYRRQKELMNEIKRGELNKNDKSTSFFSLIQDAVSLTKCETPLSKSNTFGKRMYGLEAPANVHSSNFENQMPKNFSKLPGVESISSTRNHQASYNRDAKSSFSGVWRPDCITNSLRSDLSLKRANNQANLSITDPTGGNPGSLMCLARANASANSCSAFQLGLNDFNKNSQDARNGEISFSNWGSRDGRKDHLPDDYKEERRFDKHSSIGNISSGKSLTFSKSMLEPRSDCSDSLLKMNESVSQRKRTIFGVEFNEENDKPFDAASRVSSTVLNNDINKAVASPTSTWTNDSVHFGQKIRYHQENRGVVSLESSSWIDNSLVQDFELGETNTNDHNHEKSKTDLKQHSEMSGKWLECSTSLGFDFAKGTHKSTESNPKNCYNLVFTDCQKKTENPTRGLPWFLKTPQHSGEPGKNSYFMNLDSLQNCSNEFFKNDGSFQNLKPKWETSSPMVAQISDGGITKVNDSTIPKMILGIPICNMLHSVKNLNSGGNFSKVKCYGIDCDDNGSKVEKDEAVAINQMETKDLVLPKGLNNYLSGLRYHIDLNLSLEEEDALPAPSLPTAVVKIATTEIDLEAPVEIEFKEAKSPKESNSMEMEVTPRKSEVSVELCDRTAAEAIISISLSGKKNLMDGSNCEPLEAACSDCLKWFAETVTSQCDDPMSKVYLDQSRACDAEESIPYGMDYFEFMTLKLEDTKEEHYFYKPVGLNCLNNEETKDATLFKRSRRGQSKRGRQRKDFRRDVLPGLVTLSRHEVTEDLQTLEGFLLEVEGCARQLGLSNRNSTRNGRGRKRLGGLTACSATKAVCSTVTQQPIRQVLGLEDRSLVGWGKRTRRLPRQRCPNAYVSFTLKC